MRENYHLFLFGLLGWYGINDCVFSLPVKFEAGSYSVVWDLELDSNTKEKLKKIESELKNSTQVEVTQTSPVKVSFHYYFSKPTLISDIFTASHGVSI